MCILEIILVVPVDFQFMKQSQKYILKLKYLLVDLTVLFHCMYLSQYIYGKKSTNFNPM